MVCFLFNEQGGKYMALTNAFYEAVREKKIELLRIMLKNSMLMDKSFAEFNEMKKALGVELENVVFVNFDGAKLEKDSTLWNEDYLNEQMVDLMDNFAYERVEHIQSVISNLYPQIQVKKIEENKKMDDGNNASNCGKSRKCYSEAKNSGIILGIVAGAVLGGFCSNILKIGTISGIIVGGVVGGAVEIIMKKERNNK